MKLVTVEREGRDSFTRLEGLECPCCHQHTRVQWYQPSLIAGREPHLETHCENASCPGYRQTNTPEAFARRFSVAV